jgi:hypothetical protein
MDHEDAQRKAGDLLRLDAQNLADPMGGVYDKIARTKDGFLRHIFAFNRMAKAGVRPRH